MTCCNVNFNYPIKCAEGNRIYSSRTDHILLHSLILQCVSACINFISLKLMTQKSREFRQMKRSVVITWGANRNMKPPLSCPSTEVLLRFYRKIVSVVGIEFKTQIMSGCRSGDCVIL